MTSNKNEISISATGFGIYEQENMGSVTTKAQARETSTPYRWETELAPLISARFESFTPNAAISAPDLIVPEIPAAVGVVDLLGVKFRADALLLREQISLGPICSPLRIRVLDLLASNQIKNIATLARRLGSSERSLRNSTLTPLAEAGLVDLTEVHVHSTGILEPVRRGRYGGRAQALQVALRPTAGR